MSNPVPLDPSSLFTVVCRPALPMDTPEAISLSKQIWEGHDYVPEVWEEWLADPDGFLAVAEYGGQVAGFGRLRRLTPTDWWLQGLRVHPDLQGKRIASHLHHYLVNHWLKYGNGTLRLDTGSDNFAVQHLCEQTGFQKVGEITDFYAPAIADGSGKLGFSPLLPGDIPAALDFIRNSLSFALSSQLVDLGWRQIPLQAAPLEEAVRDQRAWWWRDQEGFLSTWEEEEEGKKSLKVQIMACDINAIPFLLEDFRRLAGSLGYDQAGWMAPVREEILSALEQTGYQRPWDDSLYIYARQHPDRP